MDFSDNPFRSRPPIRPTTVRGVSPYSPEPDVRRRKQPMRTPLVFPTAPKVVKIPVHFVGSESSPSQARSASALKIQKVFRGFLVRRSMKRIIAISRDVDEIERTILQSETVEIIRGNERERLRVNEMLMALLLKLDSVRGVDSVVRNCRRAVAKKAIALQERVDAIVSVVDLSENQILAESKDDSRQNADEVAETLESKAPHAENSIENSGQSEVAVAVNFDYGSQENAEGKAMAEGEVLGVVTNSDNAVTENCEKVEEWNRTQESADGICDVKGSGDPSEVNVEEENCAGNEVDNFVLAEGDADFGTGVKEEENGAENETVESCENITSVDECMAESQNTSQMQALTEGGEENYVSVNRVGGIREEEKERTDDDKRNQELLERMVEDNQKMMNMMTQLCERNEMQTRTLNSLTRRVEQLEKAYLCHILKRKKGRLSN